MSDRAGENLGPGLAEAIALAAQFGGQEATAFALGWEPQRQPKRILFCHELDLHRSASSVTERLQSLSQTVTLVTEPRERGSNQVRSRMEEPRTFIQKFVCLPSKLPIPTSVDCGGVKMLRRGGFTTESIYTLLT